MLNKCYINLNAIKFNASSVRKKIKKGVKLCAVVKADAYGHGAEKVANALYGLADYFAVALVEEGVKLRLCGIDKDILVLIPPFLTDLELAVEKDLTLAVCDLKTLNLLEKECQKQQKTVKIHIKFNSGMNRLGINSINQLESILKKLKKLKWVKLEGLFSHFACPENDKERQKALDKFLLAKRVCMEYNKNVICHISASGGLQFKECLFDMVRVGILLYGYKSNENIKIKLQKAMQVYAPILAVRKLKKGQNLLYGENRLGASESVSLVRYGYADGGVRDKSQGLVANRCMDISAIVGRRYGMVAVMKDAYKVAKSLNTIPYEVLCKCALRSEKIYLD